ncbi:MAG: RNase P subunit p30 family protein [Candidatus Heimdallarchaeaceae archaeon]
MKPHDLTILSTKVISVENYVTTDNWDIIERLAELSKKLKIMALGIENLTIKALQQLVEVKRQGSIYTLNKFYDKIVQDNYNLNQQLTALKREIIREKNGLLVFSRKTLNEPSISKLKSQLGKTRLNYEIISVESNDSSILKWAVHDRRIDYLSIKLGQNLNYIDSALCSLVKQYQKFFEIQLSPLLMAGNAKELNGLIRQGKKITELLVNKKVPFVLTMGTSNPYHLRNALQLRSIARIIGIPFHQSKKAIGEYQLQNLLVNTQKLHSSFVYEGVFLEEK